MYNLTFQTSYLAGENGLYDFFFYPKLLCINDNGVMSYDQTKTLEKALEIVKWNTT